MEPADRTLGCQSTRACSAQPAPTPPCPHAPRGLSSSLPLGPSPITVTSVVSAALSASLGLTRLLKAFSGSKKPTPLPPPQVNVLSLLYNTLLEGSVYTCYHHIFNPTCSSAHSILSSALAPALVSPPQARQGPLTPTTCFSVLSSPRSPVAPDKAYTSCLLKVPSPPIPEHHSPAVPTTGRGTRCSRQSLRGAQGFGGTGGG